MLLAALPPGCAKKTVQNFTGNDRLMVERAKELRLAINAYHSETSEYPQELTLVQGHLPPGTQWPVNPYNQQAIRDSGGREFDPVQSVGTVYYEKYLRDGQIAGYRLHVFGEAGWLLIFDNSAFGAQ